MNHLAVEAWMPPQRQVNPEFSGAYGLTLIVQGWNEWKQTGVMPDPFVVASRDPRWVHDLHTFDEHVDRAKPPDPTPPSGDSGRHR